MKVLKNILIGLIIVVGVLALMYIGFYFGFHAGVEYGIDYMLFYLEENYNAICGLVAV